VSTPGGVARSGADDHSAEETMPACLGYCPISYQGYDSADRKYLFTAYDCTTGQVPPPLTIVRSSTYHNQGGDCANCVDCISHRSIKASPAGLPAHVLGGAHLSRRVFRKGVPHPKNPFARPDDFVPGPDSAVFAEYTAEYRYRRKYLVRLFTVGTQEKAGVRVVALGWELHPKSPPSPFAVPHLTSNWIRNVTKIPGGHLVDVDQIGLFSVLTVS